MKQRVVMAGFAVAIIVVTAVTAGNIPMVSDVTMAQRANSRLVDIDYTLSNEPAIITLSIETNGVAIPDSAVTRLSGEVCKMVQPGSHSIIWNAGADWPENMITNARACVTAYVTNNPPQVMVIDLGKGTSATQEDPYPVFYYNSLEALPNGGLSNDMFKTVMIVMNKISSGGYDMGDESTLGASVGVTLTQDFYAGVYQVTQRQWGKVMGTDPAGFKNPIAPVQSLSYNLIRGTKDQGGGGWPENSSVYAESFIGLLRSRTGLAEFDLPTDAQWEYACRAGSTTYFNDGINDSATNQLNVLGWWGGNSGGTTHTVGQKTPNEWGLYDMHGNVFEWCLDWYADELTGGENPVGAVSGACRVLRGGGWRNVKTACRTAFRYSRVPGHYDDLHFIGMRLFRTLP